MATDPYPLIPEAEVLFILVGFYSDPAGLGDGFPALRVICIKSDRGSSVLLGDPFTAGNSLHDETHTPPPGP